MTDKYYTPAIEEFHVSLEFERLNSMDWFIGEEEGWVKESWNPFHHDHHMIHNILGGIKKQWIRIKLLDKENIESCEWQFFGNEVCENPVFVYDIKSKTEKVPNQMTISREMKILYTLCFSPHLNENIKIYGTKKDEIIFNGNIKNKSELVRLMKQLNIA